MNNDELRELVRLLLMCGIMDKTATESGNVTDEEWLRMKNLIKQYQTEGGINCEPDKSGDLISREALKNDLITFFPDKCLEGITAKTLFKQILTDIDNAPTISPFKPMCKAKDEAICEEMTIDGHCNCIEPCPNKEE